MLQGCARAAAGAAAVLLLLACSDPPVHGPGGVSSKPGTGGTGAPGTGGTGASGGSGGPGLQLPPPGNGGGTGGTGGQNPSAGGSPESCDGVDNDKNGIVDDVDVGGDGICDCLRIATLGAPGRWGQGNVFAAWLNARSVAGAIELKDAELTAETLAKYEVIVAQDVSTVTRGYSDAEVQALHTWIKNGGGLMTLIGYGQPPERVNVNKLLSPLGLSYGEQPILQKSGGMTVPITSWQPHPVTASVMAVGVDNGYAVLGNAPTLATNGGHDVLKGREEGSGRVLVWGDEWITYDSEWNNKAAYQVELFWVNALKWLTPPKRCQVPIPPKLIP